MIAPPFYPVESKLPRSRRRLLLGCFRPFAPPRRSRRRRRRAGSASAPRPRPSRFERATRILARPVRTRASSRRDAPRRGSLGRVDRRRRGIARERVVDRRGRLLDGSPRRRRGRTRGRGRAARRDARDSSPRRDSSRATRPTTIGRRFDAATRRSSRAARAASRSSPRDGSAASERLTGRVYTESLPMGILPPPRRHLAMCILPRRRVHGHPSPRLSVASTLASRSGRVSKSSGFAFSSLATEARFGVTVVRADVASSEDAAYARDRVGRNVSATFHAAGAPRRDHFPTDRG